MRNSRLLRAVFHRTFSIAIMVVAGLGLVSTKSLAAAEPAYRLKVLTDPADAIYKSGEDARFVVTVTADKTPVTSGEVSYVVDDFVTSGKAGGFPEGKLTLGESPALVTVTSSKPLFLRCRVTFKTPRGKSLNATAAAGFSPLEIERSLPVPDDFDSYWAEQKQQLAKVAMDPKLTPVPSPDKAIECFDAQVACLSGTPVSGYFARPTKAAKKSLPAILWVHGAGVRSSSLSNAVKGAKSGMLSMDINAHGISNGKPGSFYADLSRGRLKDYRTAGRENRDTSYFRGMYLRLVRAIDFLTAQPEWDGRVVAVIGHSQGGGQSLVAGGIDSRVTMIAPGVPAICDHSGRAIGRINGWPKLVPQGSDGKPDAKILNASRYVDAVNFASRCKAGAIMSVGFIDTTCPPATCYAAYNSLLGKKQVINEPLMGHAAPAHIQTAFFNRILEHVKRHK